MPNEILLSDTLSLHSTLMSDSRHNDSTDVTKIFAGLPKVITDEKNRNDEQK